MPRFWDDYFLVTFEVIFFEAARVFAKIGLRLKWNLQFKLSLSKSQIRIVVEDISDDFQS